MYPCRFTDDAVGSLTALSQLTRLGLSDRNDVFSTDMQQQLLQQFGRDKVDGSVEMFHIIIIDTVSTFCCGCAVQQLGVMLRAHLKLLLVCMLWPALVHDCTGFLQP